MVGNYEAASPLPVYLHIPTTGGVSLSAALRAAVPGLLEMRGQEHIEDFNLMSADDRARITAISGHIPYGIHDYLGRECVYATMLRHPIDRLTGIFTNQILADERDPSEVLIRDFLTKGCRPIADNMLVRRLCRYPWPVPEGKWAWRVPFGGVTQEMYEQAKLNLSRCAAVGIFEEYEASACAIFDAFGLPRQDVPRLNVSTYDRPVMAPSPEDRQALEELNKYDLALYQAALRDFNAAYEPEGVV